MNDLWWCVPFDPYLTGDETQAQRGSVTCLESHSLYCMQQSWESGRCGPSPESVFLTPGPLQVTIQVCSGTTEDQGGLIAGGQTSLPPCLALPA